ncbi:MAG: TIGR01906 family membrane protein [Bacilli bacterium]|nr:TIGR01906 family membrane protein [Bacilli bacterium]
MKIRNVFLNILFGLFAFIFVISFSIALPIFCRFIHTLCIKPMGIVESLNEYTGLNYTFDDVVEGYNEVLNYCCFYAPFSAGKLLYSESDIPHFRDCRTLFTIDFAFLLIGLIGIIVLKIIEKKKKSFIIYPKTYSVAAWCIIVVPLTIGIFAAINFDIAFDYFHRILFPGKLDYFIDPEINHIILILPESFFMVCAIVIGVSIIACSIALFILSSLKRKKLKKLRTNKD